MTRIIINGAKGKMGRNIAQRVKESKEFEIVAGVDLTCEDGEIKIYDDIFKIKGSADVIVDFSNPLSLENIVDYAVKNNIALVIGTTGLEEKHILLLKEAAETVPIFVSNNMCVGVFIVTNVAKNIAKALDGYDIEIIEKHHNQKIDAPSGTAFMIADTIKEVRKNSNYIFERKSRREKRQNNEIGISSIRAGNIVGEHTILFGGEDEIIELTHSLTSRDVLARGALRAITFIATKKSGFYNMADLVQELTE